MIGREINIFCPDEIVWALIGIITLDKLCLSPHCIIRIGTRFTHLYTSEVDMENK